MTTTLDRQSIRLGAEVFKAIAASVKDALIFGHEHPHFRQRLEGLVELLRGYRAEIGELESMTFLFADGQVSLGQVPLANIGPSGTWLATVLARSDLGALKLDLDLSVDDAGAFIRAVSGGFRQPRLSEMAAAGAGAAPPNSSRAKFGFFRKGESERLVLRPQDSGSQHQELLRLLNVPGLEVSRDSCCSILNTYRTVLNRLKEGDELDYSDLLKSTDEVLNLILPRCSASLPGLTQSYFDDFTFHHSVNVCLIATTIASTVVKDPVLLRRISVAALLHDLGKSFLPAEIIHKPGKLDTNELTVMRTHPALGAKTLLEVGAVDPMAINVAFGHHIHDGPGSYPSTRQPFPSDWITQLISVVDVYEALTAVRPYKQALSARTAFEIMTGMHGLRGRMPIVKLLFDCLGPFPLGSVVELNTGQRGVVVATNRETPFEPKLQILVDSSGSRLSGPVEVDLAGAGKKKSGEPALWIRSGVLAQSAKDDPLAGSTSEEKRILGEDARDEVVLMTREG